MVVLMCREGTCIEIPAEIAIRFSATLAQFIDALSEQGPIDMADISIINIEFILSLWKSLREKAIPDEHEQVFETFLKPFATHEGYEFLIGLWQTADWLADERVVNCCAYAVARYVETLSNEEIRKRFGLVYDLSPEDEERNRHLFEWNKRI